MSTLCWVAAVLIGGVFFVDAFVDELDLAAAGFRRVEPKATGRPGYTPGDLLKLYIYGYLNRVRSSPRLEAECHRNGCCSLWSRTTVSLPARRKCRHRP